MGIWHPTRREQVTRNMRVRPGAVRASLQLQMRPAARVITTGLLGVALLSCRQGTSEVGDDETSGPVPDLPGETGETGGTESGDTESSGESGESGCPECPGELGSPCDAGEECESGWCVDGVCCESNCDDPCRTCVGDSPGSCAPVDEGEDAECVTACSAGACLPCPLDMELVSGTCVDRFEAPNREGELPLVMFTFVEAEAWCAARSKTLCLDSIWRDACEGQAMTAYPYGDVHVPGLCNDDETWLAYDQQLLNGWPAAASNPQIESLAQLFDEAESYGAAAAAAAAHVEALYQAEDSGSNVECTNETGVFDTTGNVEEWTRRADGGQPDFHGNLKGRYWADTRTCAANILVHGDGFRFYEVGFRCCSDPP